MAGIKDAQRAVDMFLSLISNGVQSIGLATMDRRRSLLGRATYKGGAKIPLAIK